MKLLQTAAIALAISSAVFAAHADPVKLSTGDQWLPFTNDREAHGGIATSVVRAILADMGEEAAIEHLPWARAYELTRRQHFMGTFPWYDSDERRSQMEYSIPFLEVRNVVFVRAESEQSKDESWDEVRSGVLCRPVGYTILSQIKEKIKDGSVRMVRPPTLSHCLRMLDGGRADYVMASEMVGWHTARVGGISSSSLTTLEQPVERSSLHFLMPKGAKGTKEFLDRFNKSAHRLRDNKTIDRIIERARQVAEID